MTNNSQDKENNNNADMTKLTTNTYDLNKFVNDLIDDGMPFEEILEYFNLDAGDVFEMLFDQGLIDEVLLERFISVDA